MIVRHAGFSQSRRFNEPLWTCGDHTATDLDHSMAAFKAAWMKCVRSAAKSCLCLLP